MFLTDKPIQSAKDDLLGFASFSDALAVSLTEMAPEEGIVISIEGAWGSGKTSAIGLTEQRIIIRELARERYEQVEQVESNEWLVTKLAWDDLVASRRTHVVRFNPWNFSGQENLVRAFFTEVGEVIGHPPDGAIGKAIKKITDYLPTIGTVAGTGAAAMIGGPSIAAAGGAGGKAVGESAQRLLASPTSLERAKRELADALSASGKRIVIIIDDLDRLLPAEMRAMFSLVKNLGDLPNLLYVLSFDRKVVKQALGAGIDAIDEDFLEKIIQVQLKLPPPWQSEIRSLFFDRLNKIIGDAVPSNQDRWRRSFLDCVAPYIETPRDVSRFANTFRVIWSSVAKDVDLTDLIVLTVLQIFESSIHSTIASNVEDLVGENMIFDNAKLAKRLDPLNAVKPEAAKAALANLFPVLAKEWNQHFWDSEVYLRKREQRRLCTHEYYRNYFLFGHDPDRVSRSEIEECLSSNHPEKRISRFIDRLGAIESRRGVSRFALFLGQVLEAVYAKPLLSAELAGALLDLSDDLIVREDVSWEFFVETNLDRLESIFVFGLEPLTHSQRISCLDVILTHSRGLTLAASVVRRLAGRHGLYGGEKSVDSKQLIDKELANNAVDQIVRKIEECAHNGTLLSLPKAMRLIWMWRRVRGPKDVRAWITKQLESNHSLLQLAKVLPQEIFRSSGKGQERIRSFKAADYLEILDVNDFKRRLNQCVLDEPLNEDARKLQADFLTAEAAGAEER